LSLTEFKRLLHGQMQDTLLDQYHDYLVAVKASDDPEVKRKCVAMHIQTIGAEHKEKADPNANLPVFNFTFTSTGMSATATLPMVEQVPNDANLMTFDNLADIPADELMAPWED
jgi:hypothetical protein